MNEQTYKVTSQSCASMYFIVNGLHCRFLFKRFAGTTIIFVITSKQISSRISLR